MRLFVDMDGTLAKWNNVAQEQLYEKGYFRNLEPDKVILQEVKTFIETGFDVYILSAYMPDIKDEKTGKLTKKSYALAEKKEWLKEHLPELKEKNAIFVPFGTNKAEYLRENYSPVYKNDYLLDDYTQNLNEWTGYGGTGIKYRNGINGTKGTWVGFAVSKDNPDLVSAISEVRTLINIVNSLYGTNFYSMQNIYNFFGCLDAVENEIVNSFNINEITTFDQLINVVQENTNYTTIEEGTMVDIYLDDCTVTVMCENDKCTIPDIEMYEDYGTIANISYSKAKDLAEVLNCAISENDLCIEDVNELLGYIDRITYKEDDWLANTDLYNKLDNLCGHAQITDEEYEKCVKQVHYDAICDWISNNIQNYVTEIIYCYNQLFEWHDKDEYDADYFFTGAIYNCDDLYLDAIREVVGIKYVQELNHNKKSVFDIAKFAEIFEAEYDVLYEATGKGTYIAGTREAVEAFDKSLDKHLDLINKFNSYRGDIISSDREAAAFMFALDRYCKEYGISTNEETQAQDKTKDEPDICD